MPSILHETNPADEADALDDAIGVLRSFRQDVYSLVERLEDADEAPVRDGLLKEMDDEYARHVRLREDVFYAACGRHLGRRAENRAFGAARDEHGMTKLVLWRLRRDGHDAAAYRRGLQRLRSLLGSETRREEEVLFPLARQVMDPTELLRLGSVLRVRANA